MHPLAIMREVMDKEPTLLTIWLRYLAIGVAGFFMVRLRRWLLAIPLILVALFAWADIAEMNDLYVGPAIREEGGLHYIILSYVAIAVGFGLPVLGLIRRKQAA